ncbi:MAG: phage holin family protein [Patescibacteria group bacterium]|jgi:putative membrane protein|nr:phage holin family protein [Patescibacteria group bacterium]
MNIFLRWLISAASILIAAYLIPNVSVSGIWTALILALALGFLNITIKPLLVLLTLPINILSLGLFTFVINTLIIMLASTMVKGFEIGGFGYALIFSIVLVILQTFFHSVSKSPKGKVDKNY